MTQKKNLQQQLLQAVEQRQDELLALASQLIQIPSENPPGNSAAIADAIATYLHQYGIESEQLEAPGQHVNLVAKLSGGQAGRRLILAGHTDVVPAGDRSRWDFSPESGAIRDGYLLGRGASDMKAGLAGLLFTLTLLQPHRENLAGEIILAASDDEETGGHYGTKWLLAEGHLDGDACLIAEPSSPLYPTIGQKGSAWTRLIFSGQAGHGSLAPVEGESANLKAAKAALALQQLWHMPVNVPAELQEVLAASQDYIRRNRPDPRSAQLLDHVSINVGVLQGGTKANIVADQAILELDIRLPFGATPEELDAHLQDLLAAEELHMGTDYTIEHIGFRGPANYTLPSEPVVQAVLRSIQAVRGNRLPAFCNGLAAMRASSANTVFPCCNMVRPICPLFTM